MTFDEIPLYTHREIQLFRDKRIDSSVSIRLDPSSVRVNRKTTSTPE
jgi:hypothetical protein